MTIGTASPSSCARACAAFALFGRLYGVDGLADRIAALAGEPDLTDLLDRPNARLAAGQKTRVSLAKALINRPDVLLFDEPRASVDPDTADWLRVSLRGIRARRHDPSGLPQHGRS